MPNWLQAVWGFILDHWLEICIVIPVLSGLIALIRSEVKACTKRRINRFINTRNLVAKYRGKVTGAVFDCYNKLTEDSPLNRENPLMVHEGVTNPSRPVPLENVSLSYCSQDEEQRSAILRKYESLFSELWPGKDRTYASAIMKHARPQMYYNGKSYRLLGINSEKPDKPHLKFSSARYFDYINMGEALLYKETYGFKHGKKTRHHIDSEYDKKVLEYTADREQEIRCAVGVAKSLRRKYYPKPPKDFGEYVYLPGIQTLTIKVVEGKNKKKEAFFLLFKRDANVVAAGGQAYSLVPAGEFQPATDIGDEKEDLDLWKNIMREYSEELLGNEVNPAANTTPDYDAGLFQELTSAREKKKLKVWYLGYGISPLNYKPDLLTVCVFKGDTFDEIFPKEKVGKQSGVGLDRHTEGNLVTRFSGDAYEIFQPFSEDIVDRYGQIGSINLSALHCLRLAYKHRDVILNI